MASLQTLHLAHLPPDLAVHIALYTDLQNASFLRDQLLKGNPDFEYALIDASVVRRPYFYPPSPSLIPLLLACLFNCLLASFLSFFLCLLACLPASSLAHSSTSRLLEGKQR